MVHYPARCDHQKMIHCGHKGPHLHAVSCCHVNDFLDVCGNMQLKSFLLNMVGNVDIFFIERTKGEDYP